MPGGVSVQRTDPQLLAQFYYADEELNQVATELDSLDGRKDPQRCTLLVNQFRSCQVSIKTKNILLYFACRLSRNTFEYVEIYSFFVNKT